MKKSIGARARQKGHEAERLYAKEFRNLGYKHCKTSREGSRLLDSAGIDLIFIPFNVQIKAGKQRGLNPINELKLMDKKIKNLLPESEPQHNYPNVVLIEKAVGQGKKRTEYDSIVVLSFKDFSQLIRKEEDE